VVERPATPAAVRTGLWQQLGLACSDKRHGWRTPVLATVDGDAADARTVVLREADEAAQRLLLFTDARAHKVAQLRRHPRGTLVMWSTELGWQLRCRVQLSVEDSGLSVSSRWARIKLSPAAQDYLAPVAPGTALGGAVAGGGPPAREFFAVVTAQVLSIDWLELHAQGHRRAVFDETGARWVQP
jgi:pyridoxamine 5'-phosphate oxidase